jgi:hypothetical protein
MERDYEKIGREFMEITNRHNEALKESSSDPREVYALIDRFAEELRRLWLMNK